MVPDVRRKLKFYAQKDLINFKEIEDWTGQNISDGKLVADKKYQL